MLGMATLLAAASLVLALGSEAAQAEVCLGRPQHLDKNAYEPVISTALVQGRATIQKARLHGNGTGASRLDRFLLAGRGACINRLGMRAPCGWLPETVDADGSSAACAERCRQVGSCSGYTADRSRGCCLVGRHGFLPSSGDGSPGARCFWRHRYLYDNSSALSAPQPPVPNVIWSYWQNADGGEQLPPIVRISVDTWRALNPDFEIRMLNETTVGRWLLPEELPATYGQLRVEHRTDALRTSLLLKYGGVWLDASLLLLQPIPRILGSSSRAFFSFDLGSSSTDGRARPVRTANWFLTAAPGDLLLAKISECFISLHSANHQDGEALEKTGLFSARQLEELEVLNITTYLGHYGCIFKAMDEDVGLERYWKSPAVRHLDARMAAFRLFEEAGSGNKSWYAALTQRKDLSLVRSLTDENSILLKLPKFERQQLAALSYEDLRCMQNTLGAVLASVGVLCNRAGLVQADVE